MQSLFFLSDSPRFNKPLYCCRDLEQCSDHSDCAGERKCINLYCGDPRYFTALGELSCQQDSFCQVRPSFESEGTWHDN